MADDFVGDREWSDLNNELIGQCSGVRPFPSAVEVLRIQDDRRPPEPELMDWTGDRPSGLVTVASEQIPEDVHQQDVFEMISPSVISMIVASGERNAVTFAEMASTLDDGDFEASSLLSAMFAMSLRQSDRYGVLWEQPDFGDISDWLVAEWAEQGIELWPEVLVQILETSISDKLGWKRAYLVSRWSWTQHTAVLLGEMCLSRSYMDLWRLLIETLDDLLISGFDGREAPYYVGRNHEHKFPDYF